MSDRPCISVTGKFHAKLKAYAAEHNISIASIVEHAVAKELGFDLPAVRRPVGRWGKTKNG